MNPVENIPSYCSMGLDVHCIFFIPLIIGYVKGIPLSLDEIINTFTANLT